jgi:hypothetical protein
LRNNPDGRARLRQYLDPQIDNLIELVNQELLEPANQALKAQGKKGLVVIVDSLDRLQRTKDRNLPEDIFVIRGEDLRHFKCHVVYTLPLVLTFSKSSGPIRDQFGDQPKILPMVRVQNRDGIRHEGGIALLRQMVLARAFPTLTPSEREPLIEQIFDHPDTCDRLCTISGGHIRNLLILLYGCLQKQDPPLSRDTLEEMITLQRDTLLNSLKPEEWELLRQVKIQNAFTGEEGYQVLLSSLLVFRYRDEKGDWFGLNPILAEASQLKTP